MSLFVQISLGREEDSKPDSCVMCDRAKCCRLLEFLWTALQMTSMGTVLLLSLSVKSLHTWMSEKDFIKTIKHNSHTLFLSACIFIILVHAYVNINRVRWIDKILLPVFWSTCSFWGMIIANQYKCILCDLNALKLFWQHVVAQLLNTSLWFG